ncbi:S-adenosylmethionine uptake transporter [Hasllibacter halocynthiae]|uniref:S-adenosylmethionine uptake transporter n=1 Tax=Hasllibacter halocynthiae TaxID=595589 RepID=A0A2T0X3G5_9RHOB|nr:DMT family transporter [Hasllibacter halocynthiae]PRY93471.1 S-adenosylmethionine uptake transporter [Hasllibacter halocynthiae]
MASPSPNLRGAALMSASMAAFTLNDAFMKGLAGEVPLFQAILIRGVAVCAVLVPVAWWRGALRLPGGGDALFVLLRTAAEIGAAFLFISALFRMPLANATAILQALPLTITLAGALFLGERVGWRRWTAIGVGFLGVLVMIRPGTEGFDRWSLYALGAVACVTLRDVATRRIGAGVPSLTVATAAAVGVTAWAGIMTLAGRDWSPVGGPAAWQLAGAVAAIMAAYLLSVATMRAGDVSFVAPFRYTGLVWALLLGLLLFGEWPDGRTLLGAGIVVASGLYTLVREARTGRRMPRAGPDLRGLRPR